jgi:hypothetical protein
MSKAQEVSGTIYKVLDIQTGTGAKGNWVKQSFVIETGDQYQKKIMFTAWKDKCDLIPKVGTEVTVSYNPESREYNDKWYTDLTLWDISIQGSNPKEKAPVKSGPAVKTGLNLQTEEEDDLPF